MYSKFFVIWGMHRSGTSLLAAAMRVFGAEPHSTRQHAAEDNPKGYFEDPTLVRLNDAMLAELRLNWQSLSPIGEQQAYMLEKAGYLRKALEYLETRASAAPLVMLKDPRMTRLGAFWRRVFEEAGQKPYSVITWRNPGAVASSLRQRALRAKAPAPEADMRYGLLLWLIYTQEALACTEGYPRALVNYDRFLADPVQSLNSIAENLNFPLGEARMKDFCENFVEPRLNHHGEPPIQDEWPASVRELYALLQKSAQCPLFSGPLWPATDETRLLAALLDDANRNIRENAAKMASIHAEICVLTGECKRMAAQLGARKE